jgi:hypothetical protein
MIKETKVTNPQSTNPLVKIMDEGGYIPPQSSIIDGYKRVAHSELDDLRKEAQNIVAGRKDAVPSNRYVGRPSKYSKATADRICSQIAEGHSLRSIAGVDPNVPNRATVYRWLKRNRGFRDQYAQAQEQRADAYVDMAFEVACAEPDVQRARLIVDTLKWMAGKLSPKKYGKHALRDGDVHQFNAVALMNQQIVGKPALLADFLSKNGYVAQLAGGFEYPETAVQGSPTQMECEEVRIPKEVATDPRMNAACGGE